MGPQQDVLLLALSPTGDGDSGLDVKDQFYFLSLINPFAEECFVTLVTLKTKTFQEH